MDEKPITTNKDDFERFSNSTSKTPTLMYWLSFTISLIVLSLFLILGFNTKNAVKEKRGEKEEIEALLSEPDIVEIEEEAMNFKSAVDKLTSVSQSRVKKAEMIEKLFQKFTKDVRVGVLSISSDGKLSIEGFAPSYKSVGEFMIAIAQNERLSNIRLSNVSMVTGEDKKESENISFLISSDIDLSKNVEGTASEQN